MLGIPVDRDVVEAMVEAAVLRDPAFDVTSIKGPVLKCSVVDIPVAKTSTVELSVVTLDDINCY